MSTFVDTSAFAAQFIDSDEVHKVVEEEILSLRQAGTSLLTSDYVIDETLTLIASRIGQHYSKQASQMIKHLMSRRALQVQFVGEDYFKQAWQLFDNRGEQRGFSFTDATVVVLCQKLGISDVLSLDRGFAAHGLMVRPS